MSPPLMLHLRDLSRALVEAWRREFTDVPGVTISQGDIFSESDGPVAAEAPIDIRADAVVSPANSFGFMDGGIDAVYTYQLGSQVQERLRALLAEQYGGELPVGQAVLVPTGRPEIPWCISAPTMRVPADVSETVNAYLALRAALRAVLAHNASAKVSIKTVLCPGLGTAVGQMPPSRCARQMKEAWVRTVLGQPSIPASLRQAANDERRLLE
ncbi:macro domain-containing protein [Pyxidicoccus parkwayensis]|uniref:Macro domain-containing protein n=1 Tax=Pyxidicoccus parkwayensis TaxID=2813578 RepID=A0ABX7P3T5_9BACT|nr:macro domain-containing protein [Pyxidicoccus parkwaysis]QSQ25130.1 macro domain-containing protein [Pyxidicoccus parkwaysis]